MDAIRDEIAQNSLTPMEVPHATTLAKFWQCRWFWSKDKEGNLVVYDYIGKIKANELVEAVREEELLRYCIYIQEYKQMLLDRLSREAGHLVFCYEIKVPPFPPCS